MLSRRQLGNMVLGAIAAGAVVAPPAEALPLSEESVGLALHNLAKHAYRKFGRGAVIPIGVDVADAYMLWCADIKRLALTYHVDGMPEGERLVQLELPYAVRALILRDGDPTYIGAPRAELTT